MAGKTVTKLLTDEQLDDYQELFDNHRRLRDLVQQLEELGLEIIEEDRRWEQRRDVGDESLTPISHGIREVARRPLIGALQGVAGHFDESEMAPTRFT